MKYGRSGIGEVSESPASLPRACVVIVDGQWTTIHGVPALELEEACSDVIRDSSELGSWYSQATNGGLRFATGLTFAVEDALRSAGWDILTLDVGSVNPKRVQLVIVKELQDADRRLVQIVDALRGYRVVVVTRDEEYRRTLHQRLEGITGHTVLEGELWESYEDDDDDEPQHYSIAAAAEHGFLPPNLRIAIYDGINTLLCVDGLYVASQLEGDSSEWFRQLVICTPTSDDEAVGRYVQKRVFEDSLWMDMNCDLNLERRAIFVTGNGLDSVVDPAPGATRTQHDRDLAIARVAHAIAECDIALLWKYGIADDTAHGRVGILTDTLEHGQALRALLPGWTLAEERAPDTKHDRPGVVDRTIYTLNCGQSGYVDIGLRATGGSEALASYPCSGVCDGTRLWIDFWDGPASPPDADVAARFQDYRNCGMSVELILPAECPGSALPTA
ncbi:MAG: hypothetical protein ACYC4U_25020 [Pirellulaceae bacterium]